MRTNYIFDWLRNDFLNKSFFLSHPYCSNKKLMCDKFMISDLNSKLVGNIILRQNRVQKSKISFKIF